MIKVGIIGAGYIGLPLAAIAASERYKCGLFDIDVEKLCSLEEGTFFFEEEKVDELLKLKISKNQIEVQKTLSISDIYIICVPTPSNVGSPLNADLSFVKSAINNVLNTIKGRLTKTIHIVIESTCPCGSADYFQTYVDKNIGVGKVYIWNSPERILPGDSLNEIKTNPRMLGYTEVFLSDPKNTIVYEFYNSFTETKLIICNAKTAELAKLFENSSRDVGIALANEFKKICLTNKVNPIEVLSLANLHPRVNILSPGIGVGGHCIPVDPLFLQTKETLLLNTARKINDNVPREVSHAILNYLIKHNLPKNGEKILLLGKSYKPNCRDQRNSPALQIYHNLSKSLATDRLLILDPKIDGEDSFYLKNISQVFLLVEHDNLLDCAVKWYGKKKVLRLKNGFISNNLN